MSLKYHDSVYLEAIKQSTGKGIKEAYKKLGRAFDAEQRDFTMLDAEKAYWTKQLRDDVNLTKKEKENINLHIENLNEIEKKRSIDIVYKSSTGNFQFKKKQAPAQAPAQASAQAPAQAPANPKKKKPEKPKKKKPEKTEEEQQEKPIKPPKLPPKPAPKPFTAVPDSLNPLHDDLLNDVPQTLGKIRNEMKTSTKKQLGIFIKTMRKNAGIQGYMKGNLGTLKKEDLQNLILDNLEDYVRNLEGVPRTLEELQTETFIKGEMAKKEGMTKEEAELMYGSKEEFDKYLKGKTKEEAEARITDYLLQHDPRKDQGKYKGLNITPESRPNLNIQKALQDILTNQVYIDRTKKAINALKGDEHFRSSTPNIKVDKVNSAIKHKITADDLDSALQNPDIGDFVKQLIFDLTGEDQEANIINFHELINNLGKLKIQQDIDDYRNDIYDFNQIIQEDQQSLFDEYIQPNINSPADIRVLPKGVKVKAIKEEMESDLDRYNQVIKELSPLLKIKDADRTAQQIADIERLQQQKTQYEPKAKELLKTKKDTISKRTTATRRIGSVRPHFINPTEKNVNNALGRTAEEQIGDIKNWYIFDKPDYNTGVGNRLENPLVQQNINRELLLSDNTNVFTHMDSFLITDGIEERKDFYHQHSDLSKGGIERGLKQHYYEENEEQFLQRFNSGSNGLFSQDQTKDEVNDFQNIYQIPQGNIDNKHPPQFTNNRDITRNDKTWIDNLNIFYKGATIN